jgi:pyridinium-3,5-bisthiocarboxylic acid mononucleotide nickel chelatase
MSRIAVIDSQTAGISGDMLMASLVDAGANKTKVIDAVFSCQDFLKGSKITKINFTKIVSHGFAATRLQMKYSDTVRERKGTEMSRSLVRCCNSLGLDEKAKTFAIESLKTIIAAEANVHGEDFDNVHLHEASSVDTIADLVGCAVALQNLRLFDGKIYSTKVAVGGGRLKFSHGTVPNPSSAILEIFKNKQFLLTGGQTEDELTTPTGAAMLVNLAEGSVNYYPTIAPEKIGYGAGMKKFEGFANVLRVLIGSQDKVTEITRGMISVVETNIDDISGELVGNLIERLAEVSKDVTVIPCITKKNRPAYLIRIISKKDEVNSVLDILFSESGTLGARVQEVERYVLPRAMLTLQVVINDTKFNVHVKVVKDFAGRVINAKPEFEDIKLIASRCQVPVKRAMEQVNAQIMKKIGGA